MVFDIAIIGGQRRTGNKGLGSNFDFTTIINIIAITVKTYH